MTPRRGWSILAGVVLTLALLLLLKRDGDQRRRLQAHTDSLNARVTQYQADSGTRQAVIDSALAVVEAAESAAARAGRSAHRSRLQRDSILAIARADTGDVPRALFEEVVDADSAVIRDQAIQIEGLGTALVAMHRAFHVADSTRLVADSLLAAMTGNRDAWRSEAKRANRIGLSAGLAWTLPSGQWQAYVGVGKRIRLPRFLGG